MTIDDEVEGVQNSLKFDDVLYGRTQFSERIKMRLCHFVEQYASELFRQEPGTNIL
jgi:hypothetical protein